MDCPKCHDDLTAYLDEELPVAETQEMKLHLEKCAPCREECEGLQSSTSLIAIHVGEIDPAPEIWQQLRSRLQEMPPPTGFFGLFRFLIGYRWVAALGTVAATLLLAAGMWGILQYRRTQRELESYMNDYIRMRNTAEQLHTLRIAQPPSAIEPMGHHTLENPFAEIRPVSITNPFRAEER
jgi:hypothetical protein